MQSATAATSRTIASVVAGLALMAPLAGCGSGSDNQNTTPSGPKVTTLGRMVPASPTDSLTISSPAFREGATLPVQYSCKGADTAPPLRWSAPLGAALVVDEPDATGGPLVHWIVTGIAPGAGSTGDGQTPAGGRVLPNSKGQNAYFGPCPSAGTGTHHYRFTLYQLPNNYQFPSGLAGGQAAQTIEGAATAQARLTGTFELALHG